MPRAGKWHTQTSVSVTGSSRRTQQTPDRPALTFEGVTRSFAEMQTAHRSAGHRAESGGTLPRGPGRVSLGFNQPVYFDLLFAAARLGAIFVPLNFRLTGPELDYIINDAGFTRWWSMARTGRSSMLASAISYAAGFTFFC